MAKLPIKRKHVFYATKVVHKLTLVYTTQNMLLHIQELVSTLMLPEIAAPILIGAIVEIIYEQVFDEDIKQAFDLIERIESESLAIGESEIEHVESVL